MFHWPGTLTLLVGETSMESNMSCCGLDIVR